MAELVLLMEPLIMRAHHSCTPPWGAGVRTYCEVGVGLAVTTSRIAESACSWTVGSATDRPTSEEILEEFENVDSLMFR